MRLTRVFDPRVGRCEDNFGNREAAFIVNESIFNRRVLVFLNWSHKEFAAFARKQGAADYKDDESYDGDFAAFST